MVVFPGHDLYREAFLCTYRGFIRPTDTISKLQHRYPQKLSYYLQRSEVTLYADDLIRFLLTRGLMYKGSRGFPPETWRTPNMKEQCAQIHPDV